MSVLTRAWERVNRDQTELEAEDLSAACARQGCRRIEAVREKEMATVTGAVHSIAVPPRGEAPELRAELYDGTGVLRLVWLGRRSIEGIVPGVYLTVHGRVGQRDGAMTIYNPAYNLLPARG